MGKDSPTAFKVRRSGETREYQEFVNELNLSARGHLEGRALIQMYGLQTTCLKRDERSLQNGSWIDSGDAIRASIAVFDHSLVLQASFCLLQEKPGDAASVMKIGTSGISPLPFGFRFVRHRKGRV